MTGEQKLLIGLDELRIAMLNEGSPTGAKICKDAHDYISNRLEKLVKPPSEILILFKRIYLTEPPIYVDAYSDYNVVYNIMCKLNQQNDGYNYFIESVIPKAKSV